MLKVIRTVVLLVVLLAASPAVASAAVVGTDVPQVDGNPDVRGAVAGWTDDGWLVFGITIHRSLLFAGEDVGVFIDTGGQPGSDWQIKLHQYGDGTVGTVLLMANGGNWMYLENGSTAGGYVGSGGVVMVYVHSSDLGAPRSVGFAAFSHGGPYASAYDFAPNAGYWGLSAPSQASTARPAAGAQPPVTETTPVQPVDPTDGDTGTAPVDATLSASKAKSAIRTHVRRRVPTGAKLVLRSCAKAGTTQYRCQVRATKRGRVWKGIATAQMSPAGTYTVSYRKR